MVVVYIFSLTSLYTVRVELQCIYLLVSPVFRSLYCPLSGMVSYRKFIYIIHIQLFLQQPNTDMISGQE